MANETEKKRKKAPFTVAYDADTREVVYKDADGEARASVDKYNPMIRDYAIGFGIINRVNNKASLSAGDNGAVDQDERRRVAREEFIWLTTATEWARGRGGPRMDRETRMLLEALVQYYPDRDRVEMETKLLGMPPEQRDAMMLVPDIAEIIAEIRKENAAKVEVDLDAF